MFTLKGEQMTSSWGEAIGKEWLPSSSYKETYSCTIERCDGDRFANMLCKEV